MLVQHAINTRGCNLPPLPRTALGLFTLGPLGVRVFFVISGFLITTLLLSEARRTGSVSLLHFYFRRTLRIFPPFYLYLAVISLLAAAGSLTLQPYDMLHALTYTVNYHRHRAWHIGHAWSLSVEEQFYLLWPALFRWLGDVAAGRALVIYLLLAPVWRMVVALAWPAQQLGIGETFFTTADAIATGCLLALWRPRLLANPAYRRHVDSRWFFALPPALFAVNALGRFAKLDWLVGTTVQNLLIAVLVERLTRETGWMGRALNLRPVVLVGLWSYSVYLWQQVFLNHHDQASWYTAFPQNLGLVVCVAAVSYYVVERPFLLWRERLESRFFVAARPAPSCAA